MARDEQHAYAVEYKNEYGERCEKIVIAKDGRTARRKAKDMGLDVRGVSGLYQK